MTGQVVKMESTALSAMTEQQMMEVLGNSLYPGANPDSIKLVLGYCKAAGLDPMQKPVHIVPMDVAVKNGSNTTYVKRDVVMPGIGLYRTQASRTNQYAGVSEPEFGPPKKIAIQRRQYNNATRDDKTFTMVADGEMEYPEWCKVTVKRMVAGTIVEFTAKEFWLENYATSGKDSNAPNAMWKRRPYAQLAKCAEAQALRKAFPELGAAPTADEMEGRPMEEDFHGTTIDGKTGVVDVGTGGGPQPYPESKFTKNLPAWKELIEKGKKTAEQIVATVSTSAVMTEEQRKQLHAIKKAEGGPKVEVGEKTYAEVEEALNKAENSAELEAAAGLIKQVKGQELKEELQGLHKKLKVVGTGGQE